MLVHSVPISSGFQGGRRSTIVIELPRREHSRRNSPRCSSGMRDSQKTSTADCAASRGSDGTAGSYTTFEQATAPHRGSRPLLRSVAAAGFAEPPQERARLLTAGDRDPVTPAESRYPYGCPATQTHQPTHPTKKACKYRPSQKRLMGFEPSTFCMASRTWSADSARTSLQAAGFRDRGAQEGLPGLHREITGIWVPNGHPSWPTRWLASRLMPKMDPTTSSPSLTG
jgi:hypothetical protein